MSKKKNQNTILLFVIVGIVVFSLIFTGFLNSFRFSSKKEITTSLRENDWFLGDKTKAKVIVIEYSDFQCPACRAFFPIIKDLKKKYNDEILFVYRHFPLIEIHSNAILAAKAAEAAGNQNKFWQMHDMLFERQDDWKNDKNPKERFISYAKELDLDIKKFEEDFNSETTTKKILEQRNESLALGLRGTPSFFVNGKLIEIKRFEDLEKSIQEELQK
ncbi:MAG: hypothetical protein C4278_00480 [Patescibacteria group bacterium]